MSDIDGLFSNIVEILLPILFWEPVKGFIPFILLVLLFGGIFFTLRYRCVHLRLLKHCYYVIRGRYDNPNDKGQITHFQALTSALSGTIGLGNIAGVAVAISLGGPGAVFWLWVSAFFGMSMKFSSCTLSQVYRKFDSKGRVLGGPMVYLSEGFKQLFPRFKYLGQFFGVFYSISVMLGALGAVSIFQTNQTFELISGQFPFLSDYGLLIGLVMSALTGFVIIGGITRIGEFTSKLVPSMCIFYIVSCLIIIFSHISLMPAIIKDIFVQAFSPQAMFGGMLAVMIVGMKRASFSNESGLGSAAIVHAAAKTNEPVREGVVAMVGPVIDTFIICTITSLTILVTNSHLDPSLSGKGAQITAKAFASLHYIMPYLLTLASIVFAFSTMITWSYYGAKGAQHILGSKAVFIYRIIYISLIIVAPILQLKHIIDLADMLLLLMGVPNIIGMIFFSKHISNLEKDYTSRLKKGEMTVYK